MELNVKPPIVYRLLKSRSSNKYMLKFIKSFI